MRQSFLVALLLVTGCDSPAETKPGDNLASAVPESPCARQRFEGSDFTVCDPGGGRIELVAGARDETPVRGLDELDRTLGRRATQVAFAMNAGMYGEDGRPIGLAIVEGKQVRPINRRKGGGNFHLLPNGVFQVYADGRAEVVPTIQWRPSPTIRMATQSGPMLVIAGEMHPAFDQDGSSRHIRNGVGVDFEGRALFVISEGAVSLGKFARFFRDRLRARNALFFDGAVSALWDPANGRRDITVPLGPMVVVFTPAESAPGLEGRAKP